MDREGNYVYCIIGTTQERTFGPIGVGGRNDDVLTIGYANLSMVVSSLPVSKLVVNDENLLAHERVIEKVMEEFDSVLPVKFGTIAYSTDEIRNLLDRRHREFENCLKDMDHKVELGVKGSWKNMDAVFKKIVNKNKNIKQLKEKIQKSPSKKNNQTKIELGKMVEKALEKEKEKEAEMIIDALRRTAYDHKVNRTVNEMFINASFLVDKGREKEFDNIMDELSDKYEAKIKFIYTGPLPVFNFVNIAIYPEEWEKP